MNWAWIAWNVFEHLVEIDKDGKLVPRLATAWQWLDDQTLEMTLRQGVTFHNGEIFNADIVKLNWDEYIRLGSHTGLVPIGTSNRDRGWRFSIRIRCASCCRNRTAGSWPGWSSCISAIASSITNSAGASRVGELSKALARHGPI